jgi:hypothetical protein
VEEIIQISKPLFISVLGDLLRQSVTSHLREYIYSLHLTCDTCILQSVVTPLLNIHKICSFFHPFIRCAGKQVRFLDLETDQWENLPDLIYSTGRIRG